MLSEFLICNQSNIYLNTYFESSNKNYYFLLSKKSPQGDFMARNGWDIGMCYMNRVKNMCNIKFDIFNMRPEIRDVLR